MGAGIAGLTAAYELTKLGFEVKILEATRRAGGRNFTARAGDVLVEERSRQVCGFDRADHLYANLGPARIPYHHDRILGYCREFGVDLEVFTNDNRAALFHAGRSGRTLVARQLHADVRGHIAELLAKAVNKGALDEELSGLDREAFLDMLATFGGLGVSRTHIGSDRAGFLTRINPGLEAPETLATPASTALATILGDEVFHGYQLVFDQGLNQQPTLFQPIGGMDRIIHAFMERVGHLVQYESAVERIENTYGKGASEATGVVVTYRGSKNELRQEHADFVICTIPATVLRGIATNFRRELVEEIAAMQYVEAVKIAAQAERRFWEEDLRIYGGISWTDQDITQVWYPASGYHRAKGVLLLAYTWEAHTNAFFGERSPAERLDAARSQVDAIHPGASAVIGPGISRAWGEVPFQKGSWANDDPDFQKHAELARGDGRVHFAGEHVSFLHGWQEGSILSTRAAIRSIAKQASANH
ncbi:flavin monoamine oxidase family protein [Polyangium aurulentum]|uniref:flavin monoamine oxidase family protein n=1 Tax=Polyangium aurulentum TaxID=2567896 RepID=UPI00146BAD72|nr:FAD-dependent oxidoreductase [Polyangium aurulentum]UQA59832.1 FAD-dependent oxidoreductase [Polyangium aurulentum]